MRYYIATHGCYLDDEKVDLQKVTLEFFAGENECVSFKEVYTDSFCTESIYKKKGYKPVFKKKKEYFQMIFGNEEGETIRGSIYCCTMKEEIYNFKDGDLLLSDVLKIITQHNNTYYPTPIYLSVLTCNINCDSEEGNDYGVTLHRKKSFREHFFFSKQVKTAHQLKERRKTRSSLFHLPEKRKTRKHELKTGDRVLYDKKLGVLKRSDKDFLLDGQKIDKKRILFFPYEVGDYVLYKDENYKIIDISDKIVIEHLRDMHHEITNLTDMYKVNYPNIHIHDYVWYQGVFCSVDHLTPDHQAIIRNVYTHETIPVNILDVYKVDFPIKYGDYVSYRGELYVVDDIVDEHRAIIRHIQTNEIENVDIFEVYVSNGS